MLSGLSLAKTITDTELIHALRIVRSTNVGSKTFFRLVESFGSLEKALDGLQILSQKNKTKAIKIFSKSDAEREIDFAHKYKAQIITYNSPQYPNLLSQIPDLPPILTCLGNLKLLNEPTVAIVGARNASANGYQFANKIAKELVYNNFVTISGLARGIDTSVHKADCTKTIAVIAGGIDNIYPFENKLLYEQVGKEGLIITEAQFSAAPSAKHFPQRNRLIAGIALGCAIIEAGLNSGSLITANFALDYNREVFAMPGFPLDPRSQGTNKLIKNGAHLLEKIEDILENILQSPISSNVSDYNNDNLKFKTPKFCHFDQVTDLMRNQIKSLLSYNQTSLNYLIEYSQLSLPLIYTILLEMELTGTIKWCSGNKISLTLKN